jgi:DNA (cytosine-5)-methyltransferase 1
MSLAAPAQSLPMIIDSFAGGGGASTGIERALGRSPDVAINHSAAALALHAANHPDTLHLDSNIWDVDPLTVTGGRKVGLLWASPDCKHFSKAKGGAPRDRNIRDLAWIVVRWAEDVKPDVICMENVEEFPTWGPVDNEGQPIKEFAGQTYELWLNRLKKAGYRCQSRELRACDFGAPTIRKRWFFIARRDGRPIKWPKPTHGDPKSKEVKRGKLRPWRTAAECIDWTLPCPSIFDTKDQIMAKHGLRAQRPLAENTLARVARGMQRYVLGAEKPFLVNLTHGGRTEPADEPFRTITGAHRGEKAVICPSITRFNSGATRQDMRDPMATVTANSWIAKPGGAAPLGMITQYLASVAHGDSGGRREYPLADPFGVVLAGGITHCVVAPSLLSLKGTARRDGTVDAPHPTVLAGGGHSALIAPLLATMRNSQKPWQGADEPTHTITAGGAGLSLIAPVLTYAQQGGGNRPATGPHHTICASRKDQNMTLAAFLAQQNGGPSMEGNAGRAADLPMSTVTASGSQQTPVAAFFAKYYGAGTGARVDEPAHTITVNDRFGHIQAALHAPPFTPDHEPRARQVADFLRSHGAWAGGQIVTLEIDGATFVVVDIGLRMLTPRELFKAQGFPDDYVIEGVWLDQNTQTPRWHPFPGHVQVSCCGNSVCPDVAAAIVAENCGHLSIKSERNVA